MRVSTAFACLWAIMGVGFVGIGSKAEGRRGALKTCTPQYLPTKHGLRQVQEAGLGETTAWFPSWDLRARGLEIRT